MKAVKNDDDWFLMCPDKCPNLDNTFDIEYEKLYDKYMILNLINTYLIMLMI